jgi:hypothetical protein
MLATPIHAFVPNTFPCLASSAQRVVFVGFDNIFIGIDYFSMSASTASLTSSLRTRFWQNRSMPSSLMGAWFWQN